MWWLIPVLLGAGFFFLWSAATPVVPELAPAPTSIRQAHARVYRPESWCLVGENTLGRYCVRSDSCGPLERFPSREACEYTEASAMPLGVTEEGGLIMNPFLSRERRYHTF